ncbi:hypothetical protein Pmani_022954 [Petrolisthes manimaculis]|uniref:Uncharacterized protein n=1 Tax=Petrolisthes manimaculis TaxID=1843537 RepID=A0AAE1PDI1_9EUCA|nr:hypothetical protein Pmani_022954 [Petrolisthes manimaculis]
MESEQLLSLPRRDHISEEDTSGAASDDSEGEPTDREGEGEERGTDNREEGDSEERETDQEEEGDSEERGTEEEGDSEEEERGTEEEGDSEERGTEEEGDSEERGTEEEEGDSEERGTDDNQIKEDTKFTEKEEDEKGKRKGFVEIMNEYLESIFSTEEEHDEEIEEELNAMYQLLWTILSGTVGIIAIIVTLTKYPQYLDILHENQLWFSNIKEVEREISFRTEQALYYSHYKHLVNSPTWRQGLSELQNDNGTEFGRTINAFHRFNILPELILSAIYRWLGTEESPSVFYVWSVFSLHGIYVATLYITAWHLSGSVLSGIITVALFVIHRTDVTRVNYTVPLRESFAVPLLFLQTFLLCSYLRANHRQIVKLLLIMTMTVALLLSWQFGAFILLCELICLVLLARLHFLPQIKVLATVGMIGLGLVVTCVIQSYPPLILSSPALSMVLPALLLASTPTDLGLGPFLKATVAVAEFTLLTLATVLINGFLKVVLKLDADSHVYQLFLSKLQMGDPKDFDSRLYMCTEAFDYMDSDTLKRLSLSGLLPVYLLGVFIFSVTSLKMFLKPVEYEEHKQELRDYVDMSSLDWDDSLLYEQLERMNQNIGHTDGEFPRATHLDRMNRGLRHIDSEIQKVAQLVACDREPHLNHQLLTEGEDDTRDKTDGDKPHDNASSTSPHANSVHQNIPSLVDGKTDLIFFIALSLVLGILAVLVMRLKVLWVPSVCVVAGVTLGDIRVYKALSQRLPYLASHLPHCLPTLLKITLCLAYLGWLVQEHWGQVFTEIWPEEVFEFYDPDTVNLMAWLTRHTTPSTTVLAGSMQLLAGVRLCTGRTITNHPHYEDSWLRLRTRQVYRIYGREAPEIIHTALRQTGATHIILEDSICLATNNLNRPLCRLTDAVDLHNKHEPEIGGHNITGLKKPEHGRFCDEVRHLTGNYSRYFSLVMANKTFRVYRLALT